MQEPSPTMPRERVDTFGIALPPEWVRFPLGDDFEQFVRSQRTRLAETAQLSRTAERRFELVMRQLRNDCQREGVSLVAALVLPIDADGELAGGEHGDTAAAGLLAVTCSISSINRAGLGTDLPLTVNTIAAAMARQAATTGDGTEIANLEAPARVALPGGPAVRLVRLHTYPPHPETRQRLKLFVEHVIVPYDDGQNAAVVTFASPNPEFAQPLSELFGEIAKTFRTFAGDEPTDLTAPAAR